MKELAEQLEPFLFTILKEKFQKQYTKIDAIVEELKSLKSQPVDTSLTKNFARVHEIAELQSFAAAKLKQINDESKLNNAQIKET